MPGLLFKVCITMSGKSECFHHENCVIRRNNCLARNISYICSEFRVFLLHCVKPVITAAIYSHVVSENRTPNKFHYTNFYIRIFQSIFDVVK